MAWIYHDYDEQSTDSARLARLRMHISEVNQQIQSNLSNGDQSKDNGLLVEYRKQLIEERKQLESKAGTVDSDSPKVKAAFTYGRPL